MKNCSLYYKLEISIRADDSFFPAYFLALLSIYSPVLMILWHPERGFFKPPNRSSAPGGGTQAQGRRSTGRLILKARTL